MDKLKLTGENMGLVLKLCHAVTLVTKKLT